nr:reverse transcriptase domain-containing protein [Tanacetum cinerariifolium]
VARRWLRKEPPHSITAWNDLERYKDLLNACPHHGFTELHQLDTFYNALNPADQDSLNAAAGGNLLEKSPQDALTIIENKSKVRNSRSKLIASPVNACDNHSSSELANLTHAVNQQTSAVTTAMTAMLKQLQSNPPPAQVKAVKEICVTCGGAHPYYQCLAAGGNTFPEYRDNIQEEDECVEETYTDPDHAKYTIKALVLMPKYQKMLKALLSNKEKIQELANTPLNENCSTVILKKLPEKLGDPGKFLIPCRFSDLKCKALADLGASINLMPLRSKQIVKPELRTIVDTPVAIMVDTHTMLELLQAPTEGYKDAIVHPPFLADNFELKVGLLQLVTSSQFHGFERDDPYAHIRWFNKIASTLKYKNVSNDAIKLMLFPFSLEGAVRTWLEKEPPRSIHTWEDLRFDETFSEAWDRFKDLLHKCPHHGFLELHQIDTFYNALTQSDQDSLNTASGGNLLNRTPRDALTIIKNKLKVRTLRNKLIVSKVSTTTSYPSPSPDVTALTEIIKKLEVEREPEVTRDKVQTLNLGSTTHVQPLVIQVPIPEPNVSPKTNLKPSIPHPLRLNGQKLREKTNTDFVVVDYDVNPRVPLTLGRPFLRMDHALVDVHGKELILRDGDEKLIFHADSTSKHPHKHGNDTTPLSDSFPSLIHFKTSVSLLVEFTDELTLLDLFPLGNEDFDLEVDLRKIEYLLNQDPSTESNIKSIDPIFEKFTDEPALDYSPPLGDKNDDDDDDLFDLKSDND